MATHFPWSQGEIEHLQIIVAKHPDNVDLVFLCFPKRSRDDILNKLQELKQVGLIPNTQPTTQPSADWSQAEVQKLRQLAFTNTNDEFICSSLVSRTTTEVKTKLEELRRLGVIPIAQITVQSSLPNNNNISNNNGSNHSTGGFFSQFAQQTVKPSQQSSFILHTPNNISISTSPSVGVIAPSTVINTPSTPSTLSTGSVASSTSLPSTSNTPTIVDQKEKKETKKKKETKDKKDDKKKEEKKEKKKDAKDKKEKQEKEKKKKEKKDDKKDKDGKKRKEIPEKDSDKKTKKKKSDSSPTPNIAINNGNVASSSSVPPPTPTIGKDSDIVMQDATISKEEKISKVFETIPKQVCVRLSCFNSTQSTVQMDGELVMIDESGLSIVDGIKLIENIKPLNWKNVLEKREDFFNFNCSLNLLAISTETSLTILDFMHYVEEALTIDQEYNKDLMRNSMQISHENYSFEYDLQNNSISLIFKNRKEIEELAEILYEIKSKHELEEAEEIEAEELITTEGPKDEIQINFEFNFENEQKKFVLELSAPKSTSYKSSICANLQLAESDILNYTERIGDFQVEASGVLPTKLKDVLSSRVDVKVVHRHVFYEQRVISFEIFERMKDIIGQGEFSSYNHLCFLVCTPDQNTLWHQTMERLERSNILPPNTKLSTVSIKYRKDHVKIFEKFRDRIANEKETLFIIIIDECHYAITKDGAHDKIVNDQLALQHNNFFVLLVSATPYNVLSVDSNIPEVYKLLKNYQDLQAGTKIQVTSTGFNKSGYGLIIKSEEQYSEPIYELIDSSNQKVLLENVEEITGKITQLMSSEDEEKNFEIGELVIYEEIPEEIHPNPQPTSQKSTATSLRYRVKSLLRNLEMTVTLSDRDLRKINNSKNRKITKELIGKIPKGKIVEIHDTVKWNVTFKVVNDSDPNREYTINDWKFKELTNYEEYNVVSWSEVQKRTTLERTEKDNETKKYFSKQDYINSLKNNREPLVFKDLEFEKILKKIKVASNTLRPIMLAIDYHFWIIVEGLRLKIYNEIEAFKHFFLIDNRLDIDSKHKNYVEICKLIYLAYMCAKYLKLDDVLEDEEFDVDDDDDDFDILETKTVKKRKENLDKRIQQLLEYLKNNFKPKNPERLFTEVVLQQSLIKESQQSLTKNLINGLIESGKIPTDGNTLRGKMKILRITTTEFANTVFKLLRSSISKVAAAGYILPDILIDTGENPLTLDQLSFISRMKLAEKVLSTEDFEVFQKKPNRLSKEKKSLEYINLHNFPCILILVAKGRQGDTFPNSFDCLDMRAKGDSLPNYSSFTQEFGRLCRYVDDTDKKPIALVTDSIYKDLLKCGEGSATSVGNTSMKLDTYMTKMKGKEGQKYWSITTSCRRLMTAVDGKKLKGEKQSPPSYDSMRSGTDKNIKTKQDHKNRLLLFAEPQIGKTDSFLHFLERVIHGIETNRMERMVDFNQDEEPHDDNAFIAKENNVTFSELEKMFPYFKNLQDQPIAQYTSISEGKYAKLVLKTREEIFKEFTPDKIRSVHKLSRIESFLTSSNYYWAKFMQNLSDNNFDLEKFQTFDGRYEDILHPKSGYRTLKFGESASVKSSKVELIEKVDLSEKKNIGLADMNYKDKLITVQLQKVFGLKIGLLESCFPGEKPLISIPSSKMNWFLLSSDQKIVTKFLLSDDLNGVKSWIFMPSWNRSASGLFYLKSMKVPYRQVIVVRHSEFKCYRNVLGGDFVIMSLPDVVNFSSLSKLFPITSIEQKKLQYNQTVDGNTLLDYDFKEDVGGIGYARMVIQILSFAFGLEFIWMMDDNCHHFEKVENGKKIPCSLSDVLIPLERIVYDEDKPLSTIIQSIQPIYMNRENPQSLITINDKISSFTPGKKKIAMIGVRKDGYRYSSSINYKPFVNSFTVCSLFLLNTRETVANGCIFPSRRYLEDIEFEYLCLEKGLYCVKSQNYFLHKPSNPLRIDYIPPAPTMYEIDEAMFESISKLLSNNSQNVDNSPTVEFIAIKDLITNSNPQAMIFDNPTKLIIETTPILFKEGSTFEIYTFLQTSDIISQFATISGFIQMANQKVKIYYYSPHPNEAETKEIIIKMVKQ